MRPLTLTVEGLRSFKSPVQISFEGRDHLAIIGDTGAGKSSIIEAITYALFGRTTFSGHANQEIINDLADDMRVTLRFTVSGRIFEVTRALRRAADRTVGGAKASLTELGDDGIEIRKVEQVRQVNNLVEEVLGLDDEAFLRTVVLPQGQFAQLLVDDLPARRAEILRQVWRTDELARAGKLVDEQLPEVSQLVGQVTQALQGMPPDPVAHLKQLNAEAEHRAKAAQAARQTHSKATEALGTLNSAREITGVAERFSKELAAFEFDTVVAETEKMAADAEAISGQREEIREQEESLRLQLETIPSDDDGPNSHAIGVARTSLDNLPSRAEAAENAAAAARTAAKEASDAKLRVTDVRRRLNEVQQQLDGREQDQQRLESAHDAAKDELEQAARLLRDALHDVIEARKLQARGDVKTGAADKLTAQAGALREGDLAEIERRATSTETAYHEVQRHNAAASAAHGLHAGADECAVCGRPLPEDWRPPAAEDLDAAREEHNKAQTRLTELRSKVDSLTHQADAAESQAEELRKQSADWMEQAQARARSIAPLIQRSAIDVTALSSVPDDKSVHDVHADLLEPLSAAVKTAHDKLKSHEAGSQQLRERLATAKADLENAEQNMASAKDRATQRISDVGDGLQGLRSALRSLPDEARFDVALPDDPLTLETVPLDGLDAARQALESRVEELDRRAELRTRLNTKLEAIREQYVSLDSRWDNAVLAPAGEVVDKLNAHRDTLARAVERLDIADFTLPPAIARLDPAELVGKVRRLREDTDELTKNIDQLLKSTEKDAEAARQVMAQLAAELDVSADAGETDHEQVVAHTAAIATEAEGDSHVARGDANEFAQLVTPLTELQRTGTELTNLHNVMTDLSAALKPGAFPKWLTLRRSRALLVHASSLLVQMSGGRYAFAELDDEAAEWRVVDKYSGLARSPASLSGGEKFIASLALALGMVEMMARSGGRLESLWLDEGFGALDRSNLDAAIEALESVTAGGRMVAVISHVRAVAEQVTNVLSVTRDATGSKARWLEPAERSEIVVRDLSSDFDNALSGLIE